jgi:hypothetical protein
LGLLKISIRTVGVTKPTFWKVVGNLHVSLVYTKRAVFVQLTRGVFGRLLKIGRTISRCHDSKVATIGEGRYLFRAIP